MKTTRVLSLAVATLAIAQTPPAKPDPKATWPKPVPEISALKMDNLYLRSQIIQKDLSDLDAQFKSIISAVCAEAGLPVTECNVGKDQAGNWSIAKLTPPAAKTPETAKGTK